MPSSPQSNAVTPAQAGAQFDWIPAYAGMTKGSGDDERERG